MIPTWRLVLFFAFNLTFGVVAWLIPALTPAAVMFPIILLIAAVFDWWQAKRPAVLVVERHFPPHWRVDRTDKVELEIINTSEKPIQGRFRDSIPESIEVEGDEEKTEGIFYLKPGESTQLIYKLKPSKRGYVTFGNVAVGIRGSLGLAWRTGVLQAERTVRVLPDVAQRFRELLVSYQNRMDMGFRTVAAGGGAWEFESLRDYTADDEYRRIHWKATARRGKPVTANFQLERAQNIMLVLENGKRMAVRHGKQSGADWAIEAALLIAFLALRSGDRVGLMVFSTHPEVYIPPSHGRGHYNSILDSLATLTPNQAYADYRMAIEHLISRQRRRSLILFLGDLSDDAAHSELSNHVRLLVPKHLPLFLTFKDEVLERFSSSVPNYSDDAFRLGAAREVLAERRLLLEKLRGSGVQAVDCRPEELAGESLRQYVQIRKSGKL